MVNKGLTYIWEKTSVDYAHFIYCVMLLFVFYNYVYNYVSFHNAFCCKVCTLSICTHNDELVKILFNAAFFFLLFLDA